MIGAGFELDAERCVLELLAEDPAQFICDVTQELIGCRQGRFVIAAADILIPHTDTLASWHKSSAFIGGAAAVLAAFAASDLQPEDRNQVQKQFTLQAVPVSLLTNDPRSSELAFELEARKGVAAHAELRDHLDYITQYFVETSQATEYGTYAFIGGGFTARRLDSCYDAVLKVRAASLFGVSDLSTIDWDLEAQRLQ